MEQEKTTYSVKGTAGRGPVTLIDEGRPRFDLLDGMNAEERKRTGLPETPEAVDYLGKALWVTFTIVVLSGIGLLAAYRPTIAGSLQSVEFIQTSYPGGWWLRGLHKYGCDLFVILAIVRIFRLMYRRAYKPPGHVTWLAALVMAGFGMVSGLTGYLLVWNQRAFWSGGVLGGQTVLSEDVYPLGGLGLPEVIVRAFFGGNEISQAALTGLFSLHIVLSLIVLLVALRWRTVAWKQVPKFRAFRPKIPASMIWTILGFLTVLAMVIPSPIGTSADRVLVPSAILSDWYFLGLYQVIRSVSIGTGLIFLLVFGIAALILPWLDLNSAKGSNSLITSVVSAIIFTWLILTVTWFLDRGSTFGMFLIAIIWFVTLSLGILSEYRRTASPADLDDAEVAEE